jgi:hypothetical protein
MAQSFAHGSISGLLRVPEVLCDHIPQLHILTMGRRMRLLQHEWRDVTHRGNRAQSKRSPAGGGNMTEAA